MIYADHAATTPLSKKAKEAMTPWLSEEYGNPSTLYSIARRPRKAVAQARETIAALINASPSEIVFTSGGTESDNYALKGIAFHHFGKKRKIITSCIEHHAILNSCAFLEHIGFDVEYLPVDDCGIVSPQSLKNAITEETILASVMMANNEIGSIEPISELAAIAHEHNVLFHTDAVQAVGHIPVDVKAMGVDMLSASAHKFNGPKGTGFLYVREGVKLLPLLSGGGQESGNRAGTENVPGIIGMAVALEEHINRLDADTLFLEVLREKLVTNMMHAGIDFRINGSEKHIPGSLSISFKGIEGETLLHRLDLMGIAIATGSACNSKETVLSHVIKAIAIPPEYRSGTIRITLGTDNTEDDIERIAAAIKKILIKC